MGLHFLYAGCGYGGSRFPKDVKALRQTALEHGMEIRIVSAVDRVNEQQKHAMPDKILARFEWRVFKSPDLDDIRSRLTHPVIFDGRNLYDPAWGQPRP